MATGRLHQDSGQGDAGTGAGLHRPDCGLHFLQLVVASAGNGADVEEEQAHRW